MDARTTKIQIFGHSFISRLKTFISDRKELRHDMGLRQSVLVQYSGFPGATVRKLNGNLEVVQDFMPDIVYLCIGTNDLYHSEASPTSVSIDIISLVETLIGDYDVQQVIIGQILHRMESARTRYPVDIQWFNSRVDSTNLLLSEAVTTCKYPSQARLWRCKGFWSPEVQHEAFSWDGVHLSNIGQRKLFSNIKAALVTTLNSSAFH